MTSDTVTGLEWLDPAVLAYADKYDVLWGWMRGRENRVDPIYDNVIGGWTAATFTQVLNLFETYTGVRAAFLDHSSYGDRYIGTFDQNDDQTRVLAIGSLIFGTTRPVWAHQVYFGSDFIASAAAINGEVSALGYLFLTSASGHFPTKYVLGTP